MCVCVRIIACVYTWIMARVYQDYGCVWGANCEDSGMCVRADNGVCVCVGG